MVLSMCGSEITNRGCISSKYPISAAALYWAEFILFTDTDFNGGVRRDNRFLIKIEDDLFRYFTQRLRAIRSMIGTSPYQLVQLKQPISIGSTKGQGHCRVGFCQCDSGWYGVDGSIPSVHTSIRNWSKWLVPAQISIPDDGRFVRNMTRLKAVVEKKRPQAYVYDLPPEFNSLLPEGRHFKFECVNMIYDQDNATVWTEQLYGSQGETGELQVAVRRFARQQMPMPPS